jgi:dihydroneopterin aldolase
MEFYGYHGVLPEERKLGQRFRVDVELSLSLAEAGISDDLTQTVNYAGVYQVIREQVEGPPKQLLEALAESLAQSILGRFEPVKEVKVSVHKPEAPIPGVLADVGCEIRRERR